MDLFSYDAAQQHEERTAVRTASVLFNLRATEQFEGFLRQAANKDEFRARLTLVRDDLQELSKGDSHVGNSAFVTAFVERIAGGAFCDDCRKWKSGPKAGTCTCGDSSEDNGTDDDLMEDDSSAVGSGEESKTASPYINPDSGNEIPTPGEAGLSGVGTPGDKSCMSCGQPVNVTDNMTQCPHCGGPSGGQGMVDFGDQLGEAFGMGGHFGAWTVTAEDNLGGKGKPSPKMDKKRGPAGKVPNTDGGPFKSETQKVTDTADYKNDKREVGVQLDHNTDITKVDKQPVIHTDTWSGKGGQADPVTSSFLTSAQTLDAIREFEG